VTKSVQVRGIERLDWQFDSFDVPSDGQAFSLEIQVKSSIFCFKRLDTREILLAQMKQEIDLLLGLDFAFDFVNFEEKFPALCFDQVMRVYRAGSHPGEI
jgi:hypothetical protein